MRVAVFSTPRTCSTLMCSVVANRFNLHNYNERIYGSWQEKEICKQDKIDFLKNQDNYVTKLFAKYFYRNAYIDTETFDWNMFDYVFITQRQNLTDQMASLYNIRFNKEDNNEQSYIDLNNTTIKHLNLQKEYLSLFYKIKSDILQSNKNVFVIEYNGLQNNMKNYLNSVTNLNFTEAHLPADENIRIDYKQKYTNYHELENLVNSWNFAYSI